MDFGSKIEKCKQFLEMVKFWTVASKIPPTLLIAWTVEVKLTLRTIYRIRGLEHVLGVTSSCCELFSDIHID